MTSLKNVLVIPIVAVGLLSTGAASLKAEDLAFLSPSPAVVTSAPHNLREGHAIETKLGKDALAVTYWVSRADGWHVVTTVDLQTGKEPETRPTIIRFSSLLGVGQSQFLSVPLALGERQQSVRIRRLDDRVDVSLVSESGS